MVCIVNSKLESINLFKGYSQEENANTHAFLAFLKALLNSSKKEFTQFFNYLDMGIKTNKTNDINIDCLKQNFGATWDGQIYSKRNKWFIAIESKIRKAALSRKQLRSHISNAKDLKRQYKKVKLTLLTPFDKDWIIQEYLSGKPTKDINYISWGDIYKSVAYLRPQGQALSFIVAEYKQYLQDANYERAGIIQMINKDIFYSAKTYKKIIKCKANKFHIPEKITGFDLPNFKVFLYCKERGGIFAFFTSKGMLLDYNRKKDKEFKYYFDISGFKELRRSLQAEEIRDIAKKSKTTTSLSNFKIHNCPAPYYFLNKKIVDVLENLANQRVR